MNVLEEGRGELLAWMDPDDADGLDGDEEE